MKDVVVVTGTGIVCSLGHRPDEILNAILSGTSGIREIQGFDFSGFQCTVAGQVGNLPPIDMELQPAFAKTMEKHLSMMARCTGDAMAQSGVTADSFPRELIGFFVGMGMIDYRIEDLLPAVLKSMDLEGNLKYDRFYSEAYREIHPLWLLSMLNNIAFCHVATMFDIRGENSVFAPHADSGARAIAAAAEALLEGHSKLVLAGGVGENVSPMSLARSALADLVTDAATLNEPRGTTYGTRTSNTGSKPLGEGCSILALELLSSAEARGIAPLARIASWASTCEAQDSISGPTQRAMTACMRMAIKRAGLVPSDLDLIMAQDQSTSMNNGNEFEAILEVFSEGVSRLNIISSKKALGDLLAGGPAVDAVLAIEMMNSGNLVTCAGSIEKDPSGGFEAVQTKPGDRRPMRAMVNAFSSEGQCECLILKSVD